MAKGTYIGVGGTARKVKNIYIGVGGVARKVKKAYIGVNGVAKQFWPSDPLDSISFSWKSTTVPSASWYDVAYGGGKFVAVAPDLAKIIYSTNGISWTSVTVPTRTTSYPGYFGVAYGNGRFVATGMHGAIYSTDGINWSNYTNTSFDGTGGVVYGGSKFVTRSVSFPRAGMNTCHTSTNGSSWSAITASTYPEYNAGDSRRIIYSKGKYIIPGVGSNYYGYISSSDLATWSISNLFSVSSGHALGSCMCGTDDSLAYIDKYTGTGSTKSRLYVNGPNGYKYIDLESRSYLTGSWLSALDYGVYKGTPLYLCIAYGGVQYTSDGSAIKTSSFDSSVTQIRLPSRAVCGNDRWVIVGHTMNSDGTYAPQSSLIYSE